MPKPPTWDDQVIEEQPYRRADLGGVDLIRFVAAIMVVLYHFAFFSWHEPVSELGGRAAIGTAPRFEPLVSLTWFGWVGVEIFFVLSGFLIASSAEGRSCVLFVRSRLRRIVPGLWFFATLTFIVTPLYSTVDVVELGLLYLKSLLLFPKGPWLDGVYWSLTVEMVFYGGVSVLIATGTLGRLQRVTILWVIVLVAFYAVVLLSLQFSTFPSASVFLRIAEAYPARVLLLTSGSYFSAGLCLYLIAKQGHSLGRTGAFFGSLIAGLVGICLSARTSPAVMLYGQWAGTPALVWLACVALLTWSVLGPARSRSPLIRTKMRLLGLATYPLYLVHNIVGAYALGALFRSGLDPYFALMLAMILCLAASLIFARWLEPPLKMLVDRILMPSSKDGVPQRPPAQEAEHWLSSSREATAVRPSRAASVT
jgi:peptidoglycan/LPS O-acetylase OafA/YrhL